jgi:3-phenylpropionate/trans-cinnamate dioxygenase ferredoxin reductase subunit
MAHYKYLIVGGGMAAAAAIKGIRDVDSEGTIGVIGAEPDPPYKRPPLSKKLWQGKPMTTISTGIEDKGAELHLGRRITSLDLPNKSVLDHEGNSYTFDKLLIATGGAPRRLPFAQDDQVIYFRTLGDYNRLRALTEAGDDFVVIGGGFIGSEIAAALAMNGKHVTMVLPGKGIGERLYPPDLVQFLNGYFIDRGVDVLLGERAVGIEVRGGRPALKLQSGRELVVDGIVAGIGIEPNVDLARSAGIEVNNADNGIMVDELLRTSQPDVYAAGDAVSYQDHTLNQRRRVEHEDNANTMGRMAGRSMAGAAEPYLHLPFFYSDLFDLGYEAVGDLDSSLEMVADWKEPYKEGVVYYLRDGRVRGVLLWNVWKQRDAARRLVAEPGPFRPEDLRGRLPEASS